MGRLGVGKLGVGWLGWACGDTFEEEREELSGELESFIAYKSN